MAGDVIGAWFVESLASEVRWHAYHAWHASERGSLPGRCKRSDVPGGRGSPRVLVPIIET